MSPLWPHQGYSWPVKSTKDVRASRDLAADVAREHDLPLTQDALSDLQVCLSEVVSNALLHAGGPCTVRLAWVNDRLHVTVTDNSPRRPEQAFVDLAESGRGLALVEDLAKAWGWYPEGAGKVVWFDIAADRPRPDEAQVKTFRPIAQSKPETPHRGFPAGRPLAPIPTPGGTALPRRARGQHLVPALAG
ncbi:ATP-binding protein [Streptomyces sp. NRRL B-24484]|uniref:ATP-binding protein n=1 Tax=Streptomyces sp. NRRL B-24484 TaxID=1463833 RepID=UPI000694FA7C|nr:ATP-binding protein [Streptomyces sp. NRRL B-24484]